MLFTPGLSHNLSGRADTVAAHVSPGLADTEHTWTPPLGHTLLKVFSPLRPRPQGTLSV